MKYNKEENKVEFTQVEILRSKALKLRHRKKIDLAMKALSKAVSLKGKTKDYEYVEDENLDVAECYRILGDIYFDKKDYDKAMAYYAEAVKLIKWTEDYEGIARCYEKKKDWDAAIAYYTKAIRACNHSGTVSDNSYYCRGKIYLEHKKNYDKAISDLKKSIKACSYGHPKSDCKGCLECKEMIAEAKRRTELEYNPEEMSCMTKQETGLPVNIFIDDGGYWLHAGHKEPRIKFQNNYANDIQINAQVPLIISEEPIIPESNENKINVEISERDLNMVKNFIRRYKNLLIKVGNPKDNLHTQSYFIKTIEKDLSYAKRLNIKNPWEKIEYLNNFDNELLKNLDKSKAKRRGK